MQIRDYKFLGNSQAYYGEVPPRCALDFGIGFRMEGFMYS